MMRKEARFADNENHLFLAIKKLEFEILYTGFNSYCLQIRGWNLGNENKKKPDVIVAFDSPENRDIEINDITKRVKSPHGYLEIVPLIEAIKKGKI